MNRKYNEYKVIYRVEDNSLVVESKTLTKRGSVVIAEHEAEILNSMGNGLTKIMYEPAQKVEKPHDDVKDRLLARAKELGLIVPKNISVEKLQQKIDTHEQVQN